MARRGWLGGGILGLVAAGGVAWWLLRRGRGGAVAGFNPTQFAEADMAMIFERGLAEGHPVEDATDREAILSMVPPGTGTIKTIFAIPGLNPPLQKHTLAVPNAWDLYVDATLLPSGAAGAAPATAGLAAFGAGPRFPVARPRPAIFGSARLPIPVGGTPAPRVLSAGAAPWHAGQLYQAGTHDLTSNVTGLWY